ncbi:hypothetical protein PTKIN_Ptkin04bG0182700 [Pterospermum kingtungense]
MQDEDHQKKPLAPVEDYPRSDVEFGGFKPKALRPEEKSSKCLVYVLAIMVIVGTVLLTFSSVFLRVTSPGFEIGSVTVRNLQYGTNSSAPSFNFTLVTEVKVKNTNFGDFRFENTTGNVWFGRIGVGEMKIPTGRAQARATERFNVSVDVSSVRIPDSMNLSSNISSGVLKLNSNGKLSGQVNVMNLMKRRRHPEMSCFMNLNLTAHKVQDLSCNRLIYI